MQINKKILIFVLTRPKEGAVVSESCVIDTDIYASYIAFDPFK
jgi:hypothetical protein